MRLNFSAAMLAITISFTAQSKPAPAPIKHLNVTLPAGTTQIDANRFQSSRSYDETKKDLKLRLKNSTTLKQSGDEINLPQVRAIYYRNSDKNAPYYGINIYLNVQTGLTDIFFVMK